MAKDPAFLFYPGDFNTGTQFFTDEQVGKYIRLLMAQHQHGHLSEQQVLHICKTYDNHIMAKFIKDDNGLWYNERLANEIVRRKDYSKSRSKNRSSKKNISKTYVKHMETETINEDIILNEYKEWGEQIIDNNDHYFQTLMHNIGPKITPELFVHLVNDHFGLLNRYPKMRPKTQQSFRNSLIKHINENYKKNGTDKKQQHTASIINALKDEHSKLFGTGQ